MLFVAAQFSCDGSGIISSTSDTQNYGFGVWKVQQLQKSFLYFFLHCFYTFLSALRSGAKQALGDNINIIILTMAKILKYWFAIRQPVLRVYHQEPSLIYIGVA